jgi:hypothetical protein
MLRVVLLKGVDMGLPRIQITGKVCQAVAATTTKKGSNTKRPIFSLSLDLGEQ